MCSCAWIDSEKARPRRRLSFVKYSSDHGPRLGYVRVDRFHVGPSCDPNEKPLGDAPTVFLGWASPGAPLLTCPHQHSSDRLPSVSSSSLSLSLSFLLSLTLSFLIRSSPLSHSHPCRVVNRKRYDGRSLRVLTHAGTKTCVCCLLSRYRASAGLLFDFNVGLAIVGEHYLPWKIFVGGIAHQIANNTDPKL